MPIYEYKCPKCKKVIELQQEMNKKISPICCEKDCNIEMHFVFSTTNFSLKGSGWSKDGYSNKKG